MVVWTVRCLRPLIAWVREGEETGIQQGNSCLTGSGLLSLSKLAASCKAIKGLCGDAFDCPEDPGHAQEPLLPPLGYILSL